MGRVIGSIESFGQVLDQVTWSIESFDQVLDRVTGSIESFGQVLDRVTLSIESFGQVLDRATGSYMSESVRVTKCSDNTNSGSLKIQFQHSLVGSEELPAVENRYPTDNSNLVIQKALIFVL